MDISINDIQFWFTNKKINNLYEEINDIENSLLSLDLSFSNNNIISTSLTSTKGYISNIKENFNVMINDLKKIYDILNSDNYTSFLFEQCEYGTFSEDGEMIKAPLYDQNDYENVTFAGDSNIKKGGCGVTSMCMILSYIHKKIITPEDLEKYEEISGFSGKSYEELIAVAAELYGVTIEKK